MVQNLFSLRAQKSPLFVFEKRAWKRLMIPGPSTAASDNNRTVHAQVRARTSVALSDWCYCEVLVLVYQPNQGCSRIESLYYISNTIPHIVGRLYEFIDTASYWLAKHKKAYPNPSCSKYSGSRPRKPLRENGWDGYAITAYLTPKVSLSFVGRQFEYLNLSHKICILLSAKYAPSRLGLSSLRLPCAAWCLSLNHAQTGR